MYENERYHSPEEGQGVGTIEPTHGAIKLFQEEKF